MILWCDRKMCHSSKMNLIKWIQTNFYAHLCLKELIKFPNKFCRTSGVPKANNTMVVSLKGAMNKKVSIHSCQIWVENKLSNIQIWTKRQTNLMNKLQITISSFLLKHKCQRYFLSVGLIIIKIDIKYFSYSASKQFLNLNLRFIRQCSHLLKIYVFPNLCIMSCFKLILHCSTWETMQ